MDNKTWTKMEQCAQQLNAQEMGNALYGHLEAVNVRTLLPAS